MVQKVFKLNYIKKLVLPQGGRNDISGYADMKSADLLSNIKKTEDQAQSILEDSQARAKRRLDGAILESSRILRAAEDDSHKEAAIRISSAKNDAEREVAALVAKGDAEISAIIASSRSSREAALGFVLSKFKEAGSK